MYNSEEIQASENYLLETNDEEEDVLVIESMDRSSLGQYSCTVETLMRLALVRYLRAYEYPTFITFKVASLSSLSSALTGLSNKVDQNCCAGKT